MSIISPQQANAFLEPLRNRVTIFKLNTHESNLAFAHFVLECSSLAGNRVTVIDTDAFYASNAPTIKSQSLSNLIATLEIPTEDSDVEEWVLTWLVTQAQVLLIDDLNTILHLLSFGDHRSSMRRLYLITRVLSFLARANGTSVIVTAYESYSNSRKASGRLRTLDRMGDTSVSVNVQESGISFVRDYGEAWPAGRFSSTHSR